MNRAAEKAVPFAKEIFWDAIGQMTFDDARKILNGATRQPQIISRPNIEEAHTAFRPPVENVMNCGRHPSTTI
jgi:hypothetical protein